MLLVTVFIANHPGVVAAFIGALITLLGVLMGGYAAFIGSRLKDLENADDRLDSRVGSVETTLSRYEEHVGAGDRIMRELADRVEKHMTEEEDKVWTGIIKLGDRLTDMHTDNMAAHQTIVERLAKVETKIPNGELTRLIDMVQGLIDHRPNPPASR
jgi:hypothetical protein